MNSRISLLLGLVFMATQSWSQTLTRTTLPPTGGFFQNQTGISLSWTLGEPFTNVILEEAGHWSEGFQQGILQAATEQQLEFTATRQSDEVVLLDWQTSAVLGKQGFIVQRRLENEKTFQTIGFIQSGEEGEAIILQFEDENDFTGKSFYRLQYAYNKSQNNSPTREVNGVKRNYHISVFPNPTTDIIKIAFAGIWDQKTAQIRVLNHAGTQVLPNRSIQLNDNDILQVDDISQLANGTYLLHIEMDNKTLGTFPFVKLMN